MRPSPDPRSGAVSSSGSCLLIALPDDPAVLVVAVPDLRPVPPTAAATPDFAGKDRGPAVLGIAGALGENILHQSELLRRDDGRVTVFHIVLRHCAVIGHSFFRQEIRSVGFLEQSAALVLLVPQHRGFDTSSYLHPHPINERG